MTQNHESPYGAPLITTASDGSVLVKIKVVPGASRSRIAGLLGDRVKIQIAAPPEGGKANAALCELISDLLNLGKASVQVIDGHSQPRKTVQIRGATSVQVMQVLQLKSS